MRRYKVAATGAQFDLPEFWHEVTLAQYLRIVAVTDTRTLRPYLEILVADTEQLLACDAGVLTELYKKVEFLKTSADLLSWRVPKTIGGITPPADINTCTINQYWSVEDWMVDAVEEGEPDTMFSWFVPLLAIYLSPILTGKPYSGKDLAESVLAQIEALPASEAVPLAAFFLRSFMKLAPSGRVDSISLSPVARTKKWPWTWFLKLKIRLLWNLRALPKSPSGAG